jgi:hypothetical protein
MKRFDLFFLDLNHLFDWNVKQLFLYLIAEYVTPVNVGILLGIRRKLMKLFLES